MPRTATATRPPVRATEIRSEETREPVRVSRRTRKGASVNQMNLPRDLLAQFGALGIDLQWNTDSVVGKPAHHETISMQQQGWEPVTVGMFDGRLDFLMPKGHKGQILYEAARLDWRYMEETLEARAEELGAARHARGIEERKITSGMVDGVDPRYMDANHPVARAGNFLKKEMGPSAIPD